MANAELARLSSFGMSDWTGHPGYDPTLQAFFNRVVEEAERPEIQGPLLTATEAVGQLVGLRSHDLDLTTVIGRVTPHHAHWKEYPGKYDPSTDLYKWLKTLGLPYFLKAKVLPKGSPKEVSQWLYEKYFDSYGINGDIQVSGEGLLDYHTGVRIDPRPQDPRWPAHNAVRLFREIDFRVGFDAPEAPDALRQTVKDEMYVLLNTTGVVGRTEYRPHLLGYPLNPNSTIEAQLITTGRGYLRRTDAWLKEQGLQNGIQGVVATRESQRLIQLALQARTARSPQPTVA